MSWPFAFFPLTDGDVAHWVGIAREVQIHNNFLTGANDQAHGPILGWTAGLVTKIAPQSFYLYNFFNLLCGMLGLGLIYFFGKKIWDEKTGRLAAFLLSTSLVFVYLSRTPMYDWAAAIFYFAFCGFYYVYLRDRNVSYLGLAMLGGAIASLSRFSISLGLAGIFLISVNLIFRRSILLMMRDLILLACAGLVINLPWLMGQYSVHGLPFLNEFLYDNIGRFVREPGNAPIRRDYYAFVIYALVGILPHTFCLIATVFQKGFFARFKQNSPYLTMLAAFLPCLIIFSFSGHVKLARYIAFVFPPLILLLAHQMRYYDLTNEAWRKRCGKMILYTGVGLAAILAMLIVQFPNEVKEAWLLAAGIIILLFGLLFFSYRAIQKHDLLIRAPETFLWPYATIYILFFSILAYEYQTASFLTSVRDTILAAIR